MGPGESNGRRLGDVPEGHDKLAPGDNPGMRSTEACAPEGGARSVRSPCGLLPPLPGRCHFCPPTPGWHPGLSSPVLSGRTAKIRRRTLTVQSHRCLYSIRRFLQSSKVPALHLLFPQRPSPILYDSTTPTPKNLRRRPSEESRRPFEMAGCLTKKNRSGYFVGTLSIVLRIREAIA